MKDGTYHNAPIVYAGRSPGIRSICFDVPISIWERVNLLAKKEGISKAAYSRRILIKYLETLPEGEP